MKTNTIADEHNPALMLQSTDTALLLAAVRGEINLTDLARQELANRGLDQSGKWVGFAEAAKRAEADRYVRGHNGAPIRVTIPE